LKLGGGDSSHEETYTASGSSIKKTQHAVAQIALTSTKFQAPQKRDIKEKTRRMSGLLATKLTNDTDCNIEALAATLESVQVGKRKEDNNKTVNPPTVRLNTLAMKLGLVANYTHTISVNQHSVDLSQTNYTNFTSSDYKPFNYSVYPSSGFAKEFENFPRQKFYGNTRMVSHYDQNFSYFRLIYVKINISKINFYNFMYNSHISCKFFTIHVYR